VGRVTEAVQSINQFKIVTDSGEHACLDILKNANRLREKAIDPEKAEYFVRVQWLDNVPDGNAITEVGLFGNQNSVCQPTTPKWRHTVERLKEHFPHWDKKS